MTVFCLPLSPPSQHHPWPLTSACLTLLLVVTPSYTSSLTARVLGAAAPDAAEGGTAAAAVRRPQQQHPRRGGCSGNSRPGAGSGTEEPRVLRCSCRGSCGGGGGLLLGQTVHLRALCNLQCAPNQACTANRMCSDIYPTCCGSLDTHCTDQKYRFVALTHMRTRCTPTCSDVVGPCTACTAAAQAVLQDGFFDLAVPFWAGLRQRTSSLSKVFATAPAPAFNAMSSSSSDAAPVGSSSNTGVSSGQAQALQVSVSAALLASGYHGFAALAAFAGPIDNTITGLLGAQALLLLAGAASASMWLAGRPSDADTQGATQTLVLQRVPVGLPSNAGAGPLSTIDAATAMLSMDMDGMQQLAQQQVLPAAATGAASDSSRGFKGAVGGFFRSARGVVRGVVRAVTGR